VGTSQAPAIPVAGYAPVLVGYGVSLAVAVTAALVAAAARAFEPRSARLRVVSVAALVLAVGGLLRWIDWGAPAGNPVRVALLQGNVAQELKWRDEVRTKTLLDYRRMIFEASARVVVLPETALPAFFDQVPEDYLESIRAHARATGKEVLMGIVEREQRGGEFDYYNTVLRLVAPRQAYRKRHLVPFGEFIPPGFRFVLAVLKIPLSDFATGGRGQAPIDAGGTSFGVAICYEDIFGEEVIEQLPRAQALLNVSNDAWFGNSFAADQHLQSSQMRALETSRWMVRATNTGVTAAIDEKGRVVSRLGAFTAGTLIADVVPRKGQTPYVLFGNLAALALTAALAGIAWRIGRPAAAP
jgi:apolipoprotein N-acyltransferase